MIKRLLVLVAALLLVSVPVQGNGSHYVWDSSYGGWRDTTCNDFDNWVVVVYTNQLGGGSQLKVKVCSPEPDLTALPMNVDNNIEHVRISRWNMTSSCTFRLYREDDYTPSGTYAWFRDVGDYPVPGILWNDAESWRVVC